MRLQLMRPENQFLGPDQYNQFFTTHGSAMMFLFAVPVMEGMGLYLVPLMIGTRNVAFPANESLRILRLPVRRNSAVCGADPEYRPGRGLVLIRAAFRAGIRHRQTRRPVVADGQPDGDRGADRCGRDHRHGLQTSGTGNVAQPNSALCLGDGRDVVHDHLRDAGGDALEHAALDGPLVEGQHAFFQSRPRAATR